MLPIDDFEPTRSWEELIAEARRRGSAMRRRQLTLRVAPVLAVAVALVAGLAGYPASRTTRVDTTPVDDLPRVNATTTTQPNLDASRGEASGRGDITTRGPRGGAFVPEASHTGPQHALQEPDRDASAAPVTSTRRIAFVRGKRGFDPSRLMVRSLDDEDEDRYAVGSAAQRCQPDWSPDGTEIAYCSDAWYDDGAIQPSNATDYREVSVRSVVTGDRRNLGPGANPEFSPDGRTIAFSFEGDIWVMSAADGSDRRRLIATPATEDYPAFSPDGSQLAYVQSSGAVFMLYVANVDGTGARAVDQMHAASPVGWSPDGRRLVYARFQSGLVIGPADGTGDRTVISESGYGADWADDGSFIVFGRGGLFRREVDPLELWVVRPDGTGLRQITSHPPEGDQTDNFAAIEPSR